MNPERQRLLARPIEEFTDNQLGFLSFEHVHCSILSLRRCLQAVNWRDPVTGKRVRLGECARPAVMYVPAGPEESVYACDACSDLFGQVELTTGGLELPHAAAVRRYNRLSCNSLALDMMTPEEAVALAFALGAALPPCPTPGSTTSICQRCFVVVTHPQALEELDGWLKQIKVEAERRWHGVSATSKMSGIRDENGERE